MVLKVVPLQAHGDFWGPKIEQELFFSNFSGTAGMSQQNCVISRPKRLISLVSRDIPNFLAPTPSGGRPLPHRKYPDSGVWVCALFLCLNFVTQKALCWDLRSCESGGLAPKTLFPFCGCLAPAHGARLRGCTL